MVETLFASLSEPNNKALIIAEAGVNHNGNIDLAHNLIDAAADAPAKPVPTSITVYFLLLAGLTKFKLNLWFVHFSCNKPSGIFALNFIMK